MAKKINVELKLRKAKRLMKGGEWALARQCFQVVLDHFPKNPEALAGLAKIDRKQASASSDAAFRKLASLFERGNGSELVEKGLALICQYPNEARFHGAVAAGYTLIGELDFALKHFRWADELDPNNARTCYDKGVVLLKLQRLEEALEAFEKACVLEPSNINAHYNAGAALKALGRPAEAIARYTSVLTLQPNHREARYNKATALLSLGRFEEGWDGYVHSRPPSAQPFETSKPLWSLGSGEGTLLVRTEQGVGDEIMFASLLSTLGTHHQKFLVQIDERLLPLFQRSMPEIEFVSKKTQLEHDLYDWYLPMEDLGQFFYKTPNDDSAIAHRYVRSDPVRASRIRQELNDKSECRAPYLVGISWKSIAKTSELSRDVSLQKLITALAHPDVTFVNLQYGDVKEEVQAVRDQTGAEIIELEDLDNFSDLDGLAALIDACDYVVSIDNATVHLAGSLGKDTCALLLHVTDWRWLHSGDRSCWYPSVTLLRQATRFDWSDVLTRALRQLEKRLA